MSNFLGGDTDVTLHKNVQKSDVIGLYGDDAVVATTKGSNNTKPENQDNYWPKEGDIFCFSETLYERGGRLYMVADGVTNGLDPAVASTLVIESASTRFYKEMEDLEKNPDVLLLKTCLERAFLEAHYKLEQESNYRKKALTKGSSVSMQTTLVAALLRGRYVLMAGVGDSHIYRWRNQKIELIFNPQEGRNPAFIGGGVPKVIIKEEGLQEKDVLILCSDGLYKYLSPTNQEFEASAIMESLFKSHYHRNEQLSLVRDHLVAKADDSQNAGGGDNITVLLVRPTAAALSEGLGVPLGTERETSLALKGQSFGGEPYRNDEFERLMVELNILDIGIEKRISLAKRVQDELKKAFAVDEEVATRYAPVLLARLIIGMALASDSAEQAKLKRDLYAFIQTLKVKPKFAEELRNLTVNSLRIRIFELDMEVAGLAEGTIAIEKAIIEHGFQTVLEDLNQSSEEHGVINSLKKQMGEIQARYEALPPQKGTKPNVSESDLEKQSEGALEENKGRILHKYHQDGSKSLTNVDLDLINQIAFLEVLLNRIELLQGKENKALRRKIMGGFARGLEKVRKELKDDSLTSLSKAFFWQEVAALEQRYQKADTPQGWWEQLRTLFRGKSNQPSSTPASNVRPPVPSTPTPYPLVESKVGKSKEKRQDVLFPQYPPTTEKEVERGKVAIAFLGAALLGGLVALYIILSLWGAGWRWDRSPAVTAEAPTDAVGIVETVTAIVTVPMVTETATSIATASIFTGTPSIEPGTPSPQGGVLDPTANVIRELELVLEEIPLDDPRARRQFRAIVKVDLDRAKVEALGNPMLRVDLYYDEFVEFAGTDAMIEDNEIPPRIYWEIETEGALIDTLRSDFVLNKDAFGISTLDFRVQVALIQNQGGQLIALTEDSAEQRIKFEPFRLVTEFTAGVESLPSEQAIDEPFEFHLVITNTGTSRLTSLIVAPNDGSKAVVAYDEEEWLNGGEDLELAPGDRTSIPLRWAVTSLSVPSTLELMVQGVAEEDSASEVMSVSLALPRPFYNGRISNTGSYDYAPLTENPGVWGEDGGADVGGRVEEGFDVRIYDAVFYRGTSVYYYVSINGPNPPGWIFSDFVNVEESARQALAARAEANR